MWSFERPRTNFVKLYTRMGIESRAAKSKYFGLVMRVFFFKIGAIFATRTCSWIHRQTKLAWPPYDARTSQKWAGRGKSQCTWFRRITLCRYTHTRLWKTHAAKSKYFDRLMCFLRVFRYIKQQSISAPARFSEMAADLKVVQLSYGFCWFFHAIFVVPILLLKIVDCGCSCLPCDAGSWSEKRKMWSRSF